MTQLDEAPSLWVGVVAFAGPHTTAGLELLRFAASMRERAGFDEIRAMRRRTASKTDFAEGIASFREKRAPMFESQHGWQPGEGGGGVAEICSRRHAPR